MKYTLLGLIFILFALPPRVTANETCSRVAIINYQEILVDTNSTQKGEGLRYHLEKDPVAISYLDKYQQESKLHWENAALGTGGTLLLLSGILTNDNRKKETMLIGGSVMILVNMLIAKTLEYNNETNLQKSVEEYNKRNLPQIYFNPLDTKGRNPSSSPAVFLNFNKDF